MIILQHLKVLSFGVGHLIIHIQDAGHHCATWPFLSIVIILQAKGELLGHFKKDGKRSVSKVELLGLCGPASK